MQEVDAFETAARQIEPYPSIRLIRRDGGSAITLDAAALLSQYRCTNNDILLVLDDDCPFEERLHLVLVRDVSILDHVVIGRPYAAGVYRPERIDGGELRFRFEGDALWTVTVWAEGKWRRGGLPSGARRRTGWLKKRHLALCRDGQGGGD